MRDETPIMKAWRDFALADPEDCDREWAVYLALVNGKETTSDPAPTSSAASVTSPTSSTSSLHHNARDPDAAATDSSTTSSSARPRVPQDTAKHDSSKGELTAEAQRIYNLLVGDSAAAASASSATSSTATSPTTPAANHLVLSIERDTTEDDFTPKARRLYDLLAGGSASQASATPEVSTMLRYPKPLDVAPITVNINATALATMVPTSCSSECPSHDVAVPVSMLISPTAPTSSTTTGGVLSVLVAPMAGDKALDVNAMGDTPPTDAISLESVFDHSTDGEDPLAMSLTSWCAPTTFNAPPEASRSLSDAISACGDGPDTDDKCAREVFLDMEDASLTTPELSRISTFQLLQMFIYCERRMLAPTRLSAICFTPDVTSSLKQQRQVILNLWPPPAYLGESSSLGLYNSNMCIEDSVSYWKFSNFTGLRTDEGIGSWTSGSNLGSIDTATGLLESYEFAHSVGKKMVNLSSLAITCEPHHSTSGVSNLLAAPNWACCLRCVNLDMEEPWECVVFLQPKPPWSQLAPTISTSDVRSNMRTVFESLLFIDIPFELNLLGIAALCMFCPKCRPPEAYFLDMKHYSNKDMSSWNFPTPSVEACLPHFAQPYSKEGILVVICLTHNAFVLIIGWESTSMGCSTCMKEIRPNKLLEVYNILTRLNINQFHWELCGIKQWDPGDVLLQHLLNVTRPHAPISVSRPVDMSSSYVLVPGKEFHTLWDPGGYILGLFDYIPEHFLMSMAINKGSCE